MKSIMKQHNAYEKRNERQIVQRYNITKEVSEIKEGLKQRSLLICIVSMKNDNSCLNNINPADSNSKWILSKY